jgi:energy-coupling factor transporter ATP-binding protein EcfA2
MSRYTAAKTRSDRPGWSVTFRHPLRSDSRGQRGLKIRKGLGTAVDEEAERLVRQLNELLGDQQWWSGDRRKDAERIYDPVVVAAFFDGIESGRIESQELREAVIPLPNRGDGYSQVLFLGTTGAGKTTLLRHLIGCDHTEDRFPSTSTAKTTTADLEIITAPDGFDAVVTFLPEHEVRAHIDECLEQACLEAAQTRSDAKIMAALLQHKEQRFRLSYILGLWSEAVDDSDFEFFDDRHDIPSIDKREAVGANEQKANKDKLNEYLRRIKSLVTEVETQTAPEIGRFHDLKDSDDRAAWLELFGSEVFKHVEFSELVLDIVDEVRRRFDSVSAGALERSPTEWPSRWTFKSLDRTEFLSQVRWFSSNHHQQFGRLLTPLVDGMRVRGPFFPTEEELREADRLVFLDGEGIGHTATTVSSVSTRITKRFESVDMILLVDNAQQPIQAGPLSLLRTIGSGGFANKLAMAFTHFDQVKGANLSSFEQKKEHVVASIRNAIVALRDSVGGGVAGALDRQIERQSVFLGGLDRNTDRLPVGYLRELARLVEKMKEAGRPGKDVRCVPLYEFKGLEIAMRDAIDAFRNPWRARLGLDYHDGIAREHWTRIKALSRRLANGWRDEYDNLAPVADLLSSLQQEASKWLDRPVDWKPLPVNDDEREAALDRIRQAVFTRLTELVTRRLKNEQVANWRVAYDYVGAGSAHRRSILVDEIHDSAAPHMSAAMSQDARDFLDSLYVILREAIDEAGGKIRPIAA